MARACLLTPKVEGPLRVARVAQELGLRPDAENFRAAVRQKAIHGLRRAVSLLAAISGKTRADDQEVRRLFEEAAQLLGSDAAQGLVASEVERGLSLLPSSGTCSTAASCSAVTLAQGLERAIGKDRAKVAVGVVVVRVEGHIREAVGRALEDPSPGARPEVSGAFRDFGAFLSDHADGGGETRVLQLVAEEVASAVTDASRGPVGVDFKDLVGAERAEEARGAVAEKVREVVTAACAVRGEEVTKLGAWFEGAQRLGVTDTLMDREVATARWADRLGLPTVTESAADAANSEGGGGGGEEGAPRKRRTLRRSGSALLDDPTERLGREVRLGLARELT